MSEIDEARVRRYAEAITGAAQVGHWGVLTARSQAYWLDVARRVIAVADEEQAALRAEVERLKWLVQHHADIYAGACEDASRAEAEVERLTRECLDREATETDARERLRRCEERLAAVEALAENWDGFLANRGDEMSHAQKHAWTTALDELRAALRKPGGGRP